MIGGKEEEAADKQEESAHTLTTKGSKLLEIGSLGLAFIILYALHLIVSLDFSHVLCLLGLFSYNISHTSFFVIPHTACT